MAKYSIEFDTETKAMTCFKDGVAVDSKEFSMGQYKMYKDPSAKDQTDKYSRYFSVTYAIDNSSGTSYTMSCDDNGSCNEYSNMWTMGNAIAKAAQMAFASAKLVKTMSKTKPSKEPVATYHLQKDVKPRDINISVVDPSYQNK